MTRRPVTSFTLTLCTLVLGSCGQRQSFQQAAPPQATSSVTAQVLVDGKLAQKLSVVCHDVNRVDKPNIPQPIGLTDDDGRIEFSTYQKADGVPEGEYALTFSWREWDDHWKKPIGPDRLAGRYADPQQSEVRLIVKHGESVDLGTIELQTK